ncbi:alpha-L-glutamate ligase [Cytobacillus sp. S13-E01]|uniref:ATP-grasp domain-containing protein n=1 Tax=Cytobacillus sp. S13-E01 TaxID=3031326 RepID=UPI0023D88E03|nr:alpha-L-glutamate ligase [Cytobacillus sp. S13-E01]MDF0726690.1 alpha-L-glutamate ligase [Cytobacillus sp. S13-E01]
MGYQKKIYVLHENSEWTAPLLKELESLNLPYEDWYLDEGILDLTSIPPLGVFYNRMSASSHTRNHRYAPEYTASILSWLEGHNRVVFNKSRALQLEVSKVAQYSALNAHGIRTPKTIATVGRKNILEAAKTFDMPFITKHNRAGKGLGVYLFEDINALERYVNSPEFEEPIDGITLIQQYIQAESPTITRCEFIGGKFYYAVQVDTSDGFELCPADACQIGEAFCPTTSEPKQKFKIIENFHDPIIKKYEEFLSANNIHFAGIEFIRDKNETIFTYDVNTNTNYNPDAEARAGKYGMQAIAETLGAELILL